MPYLPTFKPFTGIIYNAAGQKLMALPEGNEETRALDVSSFPKGGLLGGVRDEGGGGGGEAGRTII